jgi:hypothetical protein
VVEGFDSMLRACAAARPSVSRHRSSCGCDRSSCPTWSWRRRVVGAYRAARRDICCSAGLLMLMLQTVLRVQRFPGRPGSARDGRTGSSWREAPPLSRSAPACTTTLRCSIRIHTAGPGLTLTSIRPASCRHSMSGSSGLRMLTMHEDFTTGGNATSPVVSPAWERRFR